jgi:hypothetical protein
MPEDIIILLISIISESIDSLSTLNLLMRTSKSLRIAASDPRLIPFVVVNMPAATKPCLCKLFVLPEKVSLPFMLLPCPYRMFRLIPRCSVLEAFKVAMVIHEGIRGLGIAFHGRKRRSVAMKLVWKTKRDEQLRQWQARRRDIEQIYQDLSMISLPGHVKTDAEVYYMSFGDVKRISAVYRDQRNNHSIHHTHLTLCVCANH